MKTLKLIALFIGLLPVCVLMSVGAEKVYGMYRPIRSASAQVSPAAAEREESVADLIHELAPENEEFLLIILSIEDAAGQGRIAKRCEFKSEFWLKKANEITKDFPEFSREVQRDAYRCSYGPLQVAGWHAPEFGKTWADLTDLRTNVIIANAVFEEAKVRGFSASSEPYYQIRNAFRNYNGSGPTAERYADDAMEILTTRLFADRFGKSMIRGNV